jgi:hypothetical protein
MEKETIIMDAFMDLEEKLRKQHSEAMQNPQYMKGVEIAQLRLQNLELLIKTLFGKIS